MLNSRIFKNYIYNSAYEVFNLLLPLVVTPYIARVLGEDGSGQFSYTYSIVYIFTLVAALGFNKYAQRLIAQHQEDKRQQTIDFWEVMIARFIPSILSALIFAFLIMSDMFPKKYNAILFAQSLNIIAVILDVTFIFQGNEKFGIIALRNIAIKILCTVAIFLFVKESNDVVIYTLIQSGAHLLSCVSLAIYLPKVVDSVKIYDLKPMKHLPASFTLFLPTIATSVYTVLDKTLLGLITNIDAENGNYDYAEKLIRVSMTIITSLGTVIIPRNSRLYALGEIEKFRKNIGDAAKFVYFLGVPIVLGWICIADVFTPWFLGSGYAKVPYLIIILSPLVLIVGLSNLMGIQYLLPSKQDKKYTVAIVCGAAINLVLNIPLIFALKSYGAAIATLIAELSVTSIMLVSVRKELNMHSILYSSKKYIIAGITMMVPCYISKTLLPTGLLKILLIVTIGVITYITILCIEKEEFVTKAIDYVKKSISTKRGG